MQRDLVLRWIESMAKLIRAFLRRGDTPSLEAAMDQLDNAERDYLGPMVDLARRLDPASVAELLGDPYRIWGYSQLVALGAAISLALGQADEAARLGARAVALARLALDGQEEKPKEWLEWLQNAEADLNPPASDPRQTTD